jgi:uncharacterized membrane protein SirB2
MIAFYPQIKWLHVACVLASFALFALRGSLVLAGHERFARHPLPRLASYAIDTTLLSAALMLVAILPGALFANHWLSVKLVLLVAYIVCGSLALGRARTRRARTLWFATAVLVFGAMFAIARSHDPLGPWRMLAG